LYWLLADCLSPLEGAKSDVFQYKLCTSVIPGLHFSENKFTGLIKKGKKTLEDLIPRTNLATSKAHMNSKIF
jgi:hypothetical protein